MAASAYWLQCVSQSSTDSGVVRSPAALMALFDVEHMVDQLERVYEAAA